MVKVEGSVIDDFTRCTHYHSKLDIIAIKFRCCHQYYPCYKCHEESSGHSIKRWVRSELDSEENVILCGGCHKELTFRKYNNSGAQCVNCKASFNPKCALHYNIYFDL